MGELHRGDRFRHTLKLNGGDDGMSKPGFSLFVADRGAVRFAAPTTWVHFPGEDGSVRFHDQPPPDDTCVLEMSIFHLGDRIDWRRFDLPSLVEEIAQGDEDGDDDGEITPNLRGDVRFERRPNGLELAWCEARYFNPASELRMRSRLLVAKRFNIQALITFAFAEADAAEMTAVWDEILRSMSVGGHTKDPMHLLTGLDPEYR